MFVLTKDFDCFKMLRSKSPVLEESMTCNTINEKIMYSYMKQCLVTTSMSKLMF